MNNDDILNIALNMKNELIEYRENLHSHPEIGFDLEWTKNYVAEQLTNIGYTPRFIGKAGIVATVGKNTNGKTFLLRADMDALPVREQTDLPFASNNGNMHACGHDMHTSMLLGTAKILKDHEDEINGTVKLMFQPAEEIFEGSRDMIESGLLDNPKVDAGLMIHVMTGVPFETGTVIVSAPGVSAPGADCFDIIVQGKGCHGSSPNNGVDPIIVSAHILLALQEIQTRELAMTDSAVLTIGSINGGSAGNVIPDSVTMKGSLRTFDEDTRAYVKKRLIEVSQSVATTFRAKAQVTFTSECPTLVNDKSLSQKSELFLREILDNNKVISLGNMASNGSSMKSAGSEDFAYVSHEIPTIMLALSAGNSNDGFSYPQHHPKAVFDENALPIGSAVYAHIAMRWLEEE
jgi:hippurate hydrolase